MKSTRADRRSRIVAARQLPDGGITRRSPSLPGGEGPVAGIADRNRQLPAPGPVAPASAYRRRFRQPMPPAQPSRGRRLEPMTGLEPVTSSLPRTRSTTELHRLVAAPSGTGAPAVGRFAQPHRRPRPAVRMLERETGIEPATNSLEGCDSTTELLPLPRRGPPRCCDDELSRPDPGGPDATTRSSCRLPPIPDARPARKRPSPARPRATDGGEGRIRTSEAARATDLQSVAFDRSATSPDVVRHVGRNRVGRLSAKTLPRIPGSWEIACPARIRTDAPLHVRRFGRPAP